MIYANYKCSKCSNIFEVGKESIEDNFPDVVKCTECLADSASRVWGIADFCVSGGMLGNSKTGYDNNITYHPSNYGRFKTKKLRGIK